MLIRPLFATKRKPGPHPPGRICAVNGCGTQLNTRHFGKHCYLHEEKLDEKARVQELETSGPGWPD